MRSTPFLACLRWKPARLIRHHLLLPLWVAMVFAPAVRADDDAAVEQRLADSARYLSSDELEGRGLGTKGIDLAAQYVARQFQQSGLRTDLCQGTPFQKFQVAVDSQVGPNNKLVLVGPAGPGGRQRESIELSPGKDFTPLAASGSLTFDLPLVFVGYGITARLEGYDDYAGLDVAGKAVVVLRHEPQQADPKSMFAGTEDSSYTFLRRKVSNAYQHGAAAVILCTDHFDLHRGATRDDSLMSFYALGAHSKHPDMAVLHCRREAVDRAVRAAYGCDLESIEEQIDRGPKPHSRELGGWRVAGRSDVRPIYCETKNVVAMLPGEGPAAEETIVVGAHYDHLGWGTLHGKPRAIYHGADDNASGAAVLIELARSLASRPQKLHRRVVFVAFSAEEQGFRGSSRYVCDPAVPLERTITMINLDMVGRLRDDTLTVMDCATGAGFNELVDRVNEQHGLNLKLDKPSSRLGRSDHLSFYAKRVPILDFLTSKHEDYHQPTDTFEKLNLAGMRRIGHFVSDVLVALAEAPGRPEYVAVAPPERPKWDREPSIGVIPDFTREEAGLALGAVVKGGPAERAGLHSGDLLVQLGHHRIRNVDDFDDALTKYVGGDRVPAVVKRGTQSLTVDVTLDAPK